MTEPPEARAVLVDGRRLELARAEVAVLVEQVRALEQAAGALMGTIDTLDEDADREAPIESD